MATLSNTAYKIKVGSVEDLVDLVPEQGALIFDESDGTFKGSDGSSWASLGGGGGVVYTFTNGLNESGSVVKLGGDLTETTEISGVNGTYQLLIRELSELELEVGAAAATFPRSRINMLNNYLLLQRELSGTQQSQLSINDSGFVIMNYTNPGTGNVLKGFFWNDTTFQVYDSESNQGMLYNGDYSANYVDRSIVDKAYVDSVSTGIGSNTLTADTTIDGDSGTYFLKLNDMSQIDLEVGAASGVPPLSLVRLTGSSVILERTPNASASASLGLNDASADFTYSTATGFKGFSLAAANFVVTDTVLNRGLEYANDYSANYLPRSLVDKAYVDGLAILNYQNGITKTGSAVELGGPMNQNTTVLGNGGAFSLNFRELFELELEVGPTLGSQPRSRINLANPNQVLIQVEGPASQSQIFSSNSGITAMIYVPQLRGFFWNATTFQVYDQIAEKGLEYNADYSANFTANSLVTKAWVEANFQPL